MSHFKVLTLRIYFNGFIFAVYRWLFKTDGTISLYEVKIGRKSVENVRYNKQVFDNEIVN